MTEASYEWCVGEIPALTAEDIERIAQQLGIEVDE